VQLTDSLGNSVSQAGVAVTLSLNPSAGRLPAISGTTTVLTGASGLASFAGLSLNVAGSYQFTAVGTSLVSAQSNVFTITAGAPSGVQTVAGTPQSTTVLAPFATPLQAMVTDSLGNPLSGVSVTFAAPGTGASASLSSATATTDANGLASVTAVANAVVGSYTVTASVGALTPAVFNLTNLGGAGANLVFTAQPSNTAAGAVMAPVTVRVTDNGGNAVSGVTVNLTAQGGSGVLSGATPVATNASGLATFSSLSIDKTGTYSLQATDGTHFATSNSFLITPGTASSITAVAGSGQSTAVGAPYPTPLKASVQDVLGNGIPGVSVTFTAPASGASVTFSGPSSVITDNTGVAAVSVVANAQVGSFQVIATAPSVPGHAVFNLTNVAGSANHLIFVQQPSDTPAGATINPPVTVQISDNAGNNVAQAGIAVALSLNPVSGRLRVVSGTTVILTDSTGLATFSNLIISAAGNYQFTATSPSLSSAQSSTFQIAPGPPATIQTIGGTPQATTVLAPFATPLQAFVADSFGNPLSGISVSFVVPTSGASATLSSSAVATDINGRASVTATANSVVGSYTVAASISAFTKSANFALTNLPGSGSLLSFAQQPVNTPAGSTMPPVVVRLTDGGGNPITNVAVTLALVGGGTGSLSGTLSANTDANGNATFSDLRIDTTGTYQLVASSGGVAAPSNSFQIGPAVGRTITLIEGNNQSTAAGDPYATTLKAVVRDGLGNPVPGAQVTFTSPVSGASVTFAGSSVVTSAADGLATSPLATANSQPGLFNVVASTAGATAPATFTLQNLPSTASRMQFIQQPTDTVAGNPLTPAVAVQIVDRFGNPVAQPGVSINLLLSAATAAVRNITGATAQTSSSGLAVFPNLTISQAGTYQLLALATGFESAISASFRVAGGSPGSVSTAAGTPQSTIIRTLFPDPLVALVTDSAGNPLSGTTVTFSAPTSGPSGTFSGGATTAITDSTGRATSAAFTANQTAGTFTVTAAVAGVSSTATFALANLAPAAQTLAFITQPSNSVAGAAIGPPVRVQIQDSNGLPVNISGVAILITLSQGTGSLSGTQVQMTDANGVAVFSDLSIDLAGAKRLRALGSAQTSVDSNQFQVSAGSAASVTAVSGSGQIADESAQFTGPLQALVADALGNPVPGVSVTFTLPASGASGTFGGLATVQTDATGIATSPLITANNIQGVISATASVANLGAAQFVLAVIQPSGGSLRVNPTVTQFVQAFGGPPPSVQTATIVSVAGAAIPWTVSSSASWLTVSPLSGLTPTQITLSANGAGMAPGQYGALAIVSDASGNQQSIFVIFTINGTTALVAQPSQLTFLSVVGSDQKPRAVSSQTIQLTSANSLVPISYQTTAQVQTPSGGRWLTVSPDAGVTPGSANVAVDPTSLLAGVFSGFITFTPNDTTISPVSVPVTLVVGCGASGCIPPAPAASAVTNSASFASGGSPSAVQTVFGSYLAGSTQSSTTFPLPTSLAGTSVLVNGIIAPLYYVSPTQINFQMPLVTLPGPARVAVMTRAGASTPVTPLITAVQPGLYVYENLRAKALNQDLSIHTPQTPIPAGGYVVLYMTGMGSTTPPVADGQAAPSSPPLAVANGSVLAAVGGISAHVQFAGLAPGLAGVGQVNVQIPAGLAPGDQPVFVTINGVPTNAGLITVK
jgi:adhesin/invasin